MSRTRVRRRRQIAAAALSVAAALVLSAPVAGALSRHPEASRIAPPRRWEQVYVVQAGDTVWSIAAGAADGADPRAWVDAIAARNGIDAGTVVPGQALVIPRGI